ncbi:PREDICTED: SWI/SNF complex subunit SWI3A isoform X2 [Nelumbo nucifera]|uniref:SWI/SNF complex subunit SWI3A isoform X2 n=1 Tax=Nelumbo nucifera TaxID=4432 RepID=A0A1U7ZD05_NELNU|nr:PREDICTED: SWI/SNF complex subunit SWI3A isoform X2 [Nelumbo nucifera]
MEDASSKSFPANEPEQDLYTIPSYSSWFTWDEIHETEKQALKEFFDGSSISRTPKIYKEYRDFIINKYREEPSRRLTFTEVRKYLIGDVCLIHKVFRLLERWGLINFGVPTEDSSGDEKLKGRLEDGVPNGIRVVSVPNPNKVVLLTPNVKDEAVDKGGFRLPPLASYLDVFGDLMREKGLICENCGEGCASGRYVSAKGGFVICVRCFKNENYGESKTADGFKFSDSTSSSDDHGSDVWTDAETLLLLETVLKHGDDWDLVAQNVQTKSKLDCILRLIQMPFGELMLGSTNGKGGASNSSGNNINNRQVQANSIDTQEPIKTENQCHENMDETRQIREDETQDPLLKRRCIGSFADSGGSLMKQVALLATMMGPHIAAAGTKAAIAALCNENEYAQEMFEGEEVSVTNYFGSLTSKNEPGRVCKVDDMEMGEKCIQSEPQETPQEKLVPLALRFRTGIAAALGTAAAHAKLLADQEDREIERLVATIIEMQIRKIHCKIKHFEELELIMEKEYTHIEELKEYFIAERINVICEALRVGISRWKDHTSVKSVIGSIF